MLIFVDGPKYAKGLELIERSMAHPLVRLAALHDVASYWDWRLHLTLKRNPLTLLMTDTREFRGEFSSMDDQRNELELLRQTGNESHWPKGRLERMLRDGMGLWIGGNLSRNFW